MAFNGIYKTGARLGSVFTGFMDDITSKYNYKRFDRFNEQLCKKAIENFDEHDSLKRDITKNTGIKTKVNPSDLNETSLTEDEKNIVLGDPEEATQNQRKSIIKKISSEATSKITENKSENFSIDEYLSEKYTLKASLNLYSNIITLVGGPELGNKFSHLASAIETIHQTYKLWDKLDGLMLASNISGAAVALSMFFSNSSSDDVMFEYLQIIHQTMIEGFTQLSNKLEFIGERMQEGFSVLENNQILILEAILELTQTTIDINNIQEARLKEIQNWVSFYTNNYEHDVFTNEVEILNDRIFDLNSLLNQSSSEMNIIQRERVREYIDDIIQFSINTVNSRVCNGYRNGMNKEEILIQFKQNPNLARIFGVIPLAHNLLNNAFEFHDKKLEDDNIELINFPVGLSNYHLLNKSANTLFNTLIYINPMDINNLKFDNFLLNIYSNEIFLNEHIRSILNNINGVQNFLGKINHKLIKNTFSCYQDTLKLLSGNFYNSLSNRINKDRIYANRISAKYIDFDEENYFNLIGNNKSRYNGTELLTEIVSEYHEKYGSCRAPGTRCDFVPLMDTYLGHKSFNEEYTNNLFIMNKKAESLEVRPENDLIKICEEKGLIQIKKLISKEIYDNIERYSFDGGMGVYQIKFMQGKLQGFSFIIHVYEYKHSTIYYLYERMPFAPELRQNITEPSGLVTYNNGYFDYKLMNTLKAFMRNRNISENIYSERFEELNNLNGFKKYSKNLGTDINLLHVLFIELLDYNYEFSNI